MARVGRPPHSRGVFSIEDASLEVPRVAALDTSFVVNALVTTEPLHPVCQAYLLRLVESGTLIVFNRLLEVEFIETAFTLAVKEIHGRANLRSRRRDGRVRRRASRLTQDLLGAWNGVLETVDHSRYELEDVTDQVSEFMFDFGLGAMDAAHAATAELAGVDGFVTNDSGFADVPPSRLTLYTDQSRLRGCRQRRRRL